MSFKITEISKKTQNPLMRIIKLFIWIFILIGGINYYNYSQFSDEILTDTAQIIYIESGDTFYGLKEKLNIQSSFMNIYLKNNTPDFELHAGKYQIHTGATIGSILESLQNPIFEEMNITLLEGWNIYDIDEYLGKKGIINTGEYISYVTNTEKIEKLTEFFPFLAGLETLEGFLYPDTYKIDTSNFKINSFVITQLETFENKVANIVFKDRDLSQEQIVDVVTLASIVEKEEKNIQNKATVAGVLKKRLREGWMIGADITVCYPHKLTAHECKMVVSKYINEKNEYNTRTMRGLPKTPIGNPSSETVNATLNHKNSPYYFYLHDTQTGKIYYAETNQGHVRNKNLYLR
ncbi:endolytic transglycosylase MltG [Candidatus Gracilibacteria bacterium 28_42_T64]|nr:endolytic transglycosylase MltG [Candidatus Gracilibacteria bacterium 28_42_T64]